MWEVEGLPTKTLSTGQAMPEPANKRPCLSNDGPAQTLKLVLVQMSDPAKPFSTPAK